MNATKRKFNSLLNGLGNKSATSLSSELNNSNVDLTAPSSSDTLEQIRKRRELRTSSHLAETPLNIQSRSHASSSFSTSFRTSQAKTGSESQSTDKPKYAPWDRAAFLERLRSFSNLTDWTPKPAPVNEVEWAKRGWVCQKFERVRCSLCNVEILVKLNRKEVDGKEEPVYVASQIEDALVDKYSEMIITSHAEHCLWRQRGCDDTIFKLSLNQALPTLHSLRQRYDGLCAQKDLLPYMHNLKTPDIFDLDLAISYLPEDFFAPINQAAGPVGVPDKSTINRVAITMALFGWKSRPEHMPKYGASQCESCFRNLGLWLFKSKEVNEAGEMTRPASMNCLDLVEEHRDYCPWRNARSQSYSTTESSSSNPPLTAWEVVVRLLKNDHFLKRGNMTTPEKKKQRPVTMNAETPGSENPFGVEVDDDDVESLRDEKDKQRWARLKRVKSMFDTKGKKRMSIAGKEREREKERTK